MNIEPTKFLESEEWVDRMEQKLMGINPPKETRLPTRGLAYNADFAETVGISRLYCRMIANKITCLSIQRAMKLVVEPIRPTSPSTMDWRKPVISPPSSTSRITSRLVILGLFVSLLATAISLLYHSIYNDRPQYISLTTPADTALVRQIINEQLVVSYLIAETKAMDEKQLRMARQTILNDPAATDSVLALLASVKDNSTFEVSFLRGYVLLQDSRESPSGAIAALQQARQSSDLRIREEANWYLALAYLKNMDLVRAYPLLGQIANSSSGHQRYAQEIVDALARH